MTQLALFFDVDHEAARQETRVMERFAMFGPMSDELLVARSPQWNRAELIAARTRLAERGFLVFDREFVPILEDVWRLT